MLLVNKWPSMIKLAPKMNILVKSGSEQIFDTENLDTISEDRDIGNELIGEESKTSKNRYSDPIVMRDFSDNQEDIPIKESNSLKSYKPRSSGDKNEAETNDSGLKVSGASLDKISEEKKDSELATFAR